MELIAPILCNLTEEIHKINEALPKITDIKTEVCNTTDAVRQFRVDMTQSEHQQYVHGSPMLYSDALNLSPERNVIEHPSHSMNPLTETP